MKGVRQWDKNRDRKRGIVQLRLGQRQVKNYRVKSEMVRDKDKDGERETERAAQDKETGREYSKIRSGTAKVTVKSESMRKIRIRTEKRKACQNKETGRENSTIKTRTSTGNEL